MTINRLKTGGSDPSRWKTRLADFFSPRSLRVKTVLWASLPVVLILAAITFITPHLLEDMSRTVARQRDVELARISASRLAERLSYHTRSLQLVVADEGLLTMETNHIRATLVRDQERFYLFDAGITVYDAHGTVLWSHPYREERQGSLFPVAAKFEELRKTLRPVFSDIFKDPVTEEPVILVAVPIVESSGDFGGALVGTATVRYSLLGAMYAELLEFKAGRGGYAYLVDGNGRIIYHRHSPEIGKKMTHLLPVSEVIAGRTGSALTRDERGEMIIVGYAPVPGTGWGLVTQETWDLIIGPIRRDRMMLLSLLVIGGIAASAFIYLAVSRIMKPIRNLAIGAQRIAAGDFDYRITERTRDEIQILSEQFNSMASALKSSYSELEKRVEERTADLAVAKDKAEEADRLKSVFLATMSHELRTPLNSIIGFTGVMLQGLAGPVNPEQEKQLGMVYRSAKHLLSLINDILDLSKIEAGKMASALEEFDARQLIGNAEKTVAPLAEKKGLRLVTSVASDVHTVTADRRRIQQILLNLLDNAIKFTDSGSVTIDCRRIGGNLRISVEDTGMGIHPEDMGNLFETFRQVDTARTRKQDGTGLGLAICRKLAVLLGGEITAESRPGKGSKFTLTVPVVGLADNSQ
jgi:signal transduction histidine kinase